MAVHSMRFLPPPTAIPLWRGLAVALAIIIATSATLSPLALAQTTIPLEHSTARSKQALSTAVNSSQSPLKQSSESSCDEALEQLKRGLTEDRQLTIPYQTEREAFGNYPEGRPVIYSLGMTGPATNSMFTSPQLLLNLSKSFINKCDSAAAVSIGRYQTGEAYIFGLIDGQVTRFSCIEDLGFEVGDREQEDPIPWGYWHCGA